MGFDIDAGIIKELRLIEQPMAGGDGFSGGDPGADDGGGLSARSKYSDIGDAGQPKTVGGYTHPTRFGRFPVPRFIGKWSAVGVAWR
jgi:hypothetical protein